MPEDFQHKLNNCARLIQLTQIENEVESGSYDHLNELDLAIVRSRLAMGKLRLILDIVI